MEVLDFASNMLWSLLQQSGVMEDDIDNTSESSVSCADENDALTDSDYEWNDWHDAAADDSDSSASTEVHTDEDYNNMDSAMAMVQILIL
jgi:hypothetical protein